MTPGRGSSGTQRALPDEPHHATNKDGAKDEECAESPAPAGEVTHPSAID
jgi:hypothetical protein